MADGFAIPIRGGTLEIVGSNDVDHLASTSAYTGRTEGLLRTFTRQLVAYPTSNDFNIRTRPAPDLALELPTLANGGISADGRTYTFHLRRGVRWDSRPPREVTAHDVVRAFKLFCNPVNPVGSPGYYIPTIEGMARYCEQFARVPATVEAIRTFVTTHDIDGVYASNDDTIVFRLKAPASDFLNLVAMLFASAVPAEYLDELPDSPASRQQTISNGPYRMARYVQNREMILERNPVWNPGTDPIRLAYVDRIHVSLGSDGELQLLQIEAGTADLSFGDSVATAELASLLTLDDPTVLLSPDGAICAQAQLLIVNRAGPNNGGPLSRLQVRRAIALAVDKAAIVQLSGGSRVARPLRQAAGLGWDGYLDGADRDVTTDDRGDPVAARRLLAEAGYPHGLSLRLVYGNDQPNPLFAQALRASLARAGIALQLAQQTKADLYGRLLASPENARRGEWDLALTTWIPDWLGRNNGRSFILTGFDSRNFGQNGLDWGGYLNPDVDRQIDRATTAPSAADAERAWIDVARRLIDDLALIPLAEGKAAYPKSRRVRNCSWDVFSFNCDLAAVWLADAGSRPGGSR
ncbi:MAG: ABC transporter substrate-binding protein [Acidobacteriota bacterium]